MADSIYKWSLTAISNDAADSIINWRENQLPDTVNDSNRAMMQRIAEWREDMTGGLVTAGTQPAYTVTTKAAFDTLANGRFITCRIHATNAGGASTLNVNALGAKAVRKFGTSGDLPLAVGDLQLGGLYTFMYSTLANAGAGAWITGNPSAGPSGSFPSGTSMLFMSAAAPVGWTIQTTHNNKALRVVSANGGASGGATAFTTVFASRTPVAQGTAITAAQMPSHAHTQQGSFTSGGFSANHTHSQQGTFTSGGRTAAHTHTVPNGGSTFPASSGGIAIWAQAAAQTSSTESADHAHNTTISGPTSTVSNDHTHTTTISGATTAAGSGAAHAHTMDAMDFAVAYVDTIICNKD